MTRLIDDLISREALKESLRLDLLIKGELNYDEVIDLVTTAPTVQREGWVSVPIEPTEKMIAVAFEHLIRCDVENVDGDDIRSAIRYAVQAAPTDKMKEGV